MRRSHGSRFARVHHVLPLLAAMLAAVVVAPACSSSDSAAESSDGSVEIVGTASSALSSADVTRLTVIGTSGGKTVSTNLAKVGGQWRGTLGKVPVGTWTFHADAYAPDGHGGEMVAFTGGGAPGGYFIGPGAKVGVTLNLQQVGGAPTPFINTAPRIDSLFASALNVAPGDTISLAVGASDADGDALTYAWTADGGSFAAAANAATTWTAPGAAGDYTLSLGVTDTKGASAGISRVIHVANGNAAGSAVFNAVVNTWPGVDGIVATKTLLLPGDTTMLSATASDADGDPLTYAWSSTCGSFAPPNAPNPVFTLGAVAPGATTCTTRLDVHDPNGGAGSGFFTLQVGAPPAPDQAPMIDSTFQAAECGLNAGDTDHFTVLAHDADDFTPTGISGPVYPAPFGGNALSGTGGITQAGGKTWNYSGIATASFSALYWGPAQPIRFALNGHTAAPVTLTLVSISGNQAVYSGHLLYDDPNYPFQTNIDVPVDFTITLVAPGGKSLIGAPMGGGTVPVVDVLDAGGSFSINLAATSNGTPLNHFDGTGTITDFGGGFFYTAAAVRTPVTFTWEILNGTPLVSTDASAFAVTTVVGGKTQSVLDWVALPGASTIKATATSGGRSTVTTFQADTAPCPP